MTSALLLALALAAEPGLAPHMRILGVELEREKLADVQRRLGDARIQFNGGDAAAGAYGMCYAGRDGTRLYFFSHAEMGGSAHYVLGWQLLAPGAAPAYAEGLGGGALNPSCRRSGRVTRATASKGGLQLGMTSREVARLLGTPRKRGEGFEEYGTDDPVVPPGRTRNEGFVRARWVRVEYTNDRATAIRASQVTSS
jgi:hypothetical protein